METIQDKSYWFETLGLQGCEELYMDMVTFVESGEDQLVKVFEDERPARVFLNFLFSEAGVPETFEGTCRDTFQS